MTRRVLVPSGEIERRESLKAEALKRANVLNASAAWGSDWDAHLLTSLVRYVEELEARDGQIAAWLRETIRATKLDVADGLWVGVSEDAEGFINTLRIIIDGIETGSYRKDEA